MVLLLKKNGMKKFLIIAVLLVCGLNMSAQADYERAVGLRFGFHNGITYKQFLTSISAIEALAYFGNNSFNLTGLYEINNENAFQVDRLDWYYGAGGHIGFYDSNSENGGDSFILGIDGIIGIEYNLEQAPFNFSLDWKPEINIIGRDNFIGESIALSLRYTF